MNEVPLIQDILIEVEPVSISELADVKITIEVEDPDLGPYQIVIERAFLEMAAMVRLQSGPVRGTEKIDHFTGTFTTVPGPDGTSMAIIPGSTDDGESDEEEIRQLLGLEDVLD